MRECAQLLVQQDEAASAIKYYEAAQRLHADDGEFNDIHVNALAELYLIEKMYPKVDQLISATRARADPEVEFPMDLVVKQGIAQIHMGRFDMAEVGRWARGTCAPIQVTKRSPYPRAVRLGPLARKRWRRCSPANLSASPTCSWKSRPRTWSANIMPVPSRGSAPPSKAPRSVAHQRGLKPSRSRSHASLAPHGCAHVGRLGAGRQYNIALYWFRLAECYAKLDQHDLAIETYESCRPGATRSAPSRANRTCADKEALLHAVGLQC